MNSTVPLLHNTAAAATFLRSRGGEARLSASFVDAKTGRSGKFETCTFTDLSDPAATQLMADWIEARQGKANIYFSVNTARAGTPPNKKLEFSDIHSVEWLHIDIDPRIRETAEEAKPRILQRLLEYPRPPSQIISSGNGIQALWKLRTPIVIHGDVEKAKQLGLYNKRLSAHLDGDHCHDVTRILRVPGTINCPNEKKRANGRVYALAEIIGE